jgi:protein-tyrosine-phosphatase
MAEQGVTPSWLPSIPGYQHWDIEDPGGRSLADTEFACEEINHRINKLLSQLSINR